MCRRPPRSTRTDTLLPSPTLFRALTAVGRGGANIPARSGGKAGDALWVVGPLGDAGLGLQVLRIDGEAQGPLVEAYRRPVPQLAAGRRSEEHTSALQSLMRISYAVFCLKKKTTTTQTNTNVI